MSGLFSQSRLAIFFAGLFFSLALANPAAADIVDAVVLNTDANGEVDAVIKFSVPVQYMRHYPQNKSDYLEIYFNILDNTAKDQWINYESHSSVPSKQIVNFTTTTRDLSTGPKLVIQFDRPEEYTVTPGLNGRSLLVHFKPGTLPQSRDGALPTALVSPPAAARYTDALPPFPVIAPATPIAAASGVAPDVPTLADQIKKSDNQAAELMTKARKSLLAGDMYAAVETFNNVLNLPPNKYTQDAQVWVGIAREKAGQSPKARLEYETYLKLYPAGPLAGWVKERLAKLNAILPPPSGAPTPGKPGKPEPKKFEATEFQISQYGSLSMYYYRGASHTDTLTTVPSATGTGSVQQPSSLTATDQSSMITNVSATMRSYNNEFDNRMVFQDFYSKDFLHDAQNRNRLNAAFVDIKNRVDNYSARIGRQSAYGGGVLGRFDGITAGYGFTQNWRANIVEGQLADFTLSDKPKFVGASLDFGLRDPVGGSIYMINQKVGALTDRKAVGGILRYFDTKQTALTMLDYDTQFRQLNMLTVQGTLAYDSVTDFNVMLDRRKQASLSIRNAVNGTTASLNDLIANGWTKDDLIALANQRTSVSNMAMVGMTNRLVSNWQSGTDVVVMNTSGLAESGTLNPDGTTGIEGFMAATPASGNTWTVSQRLIGNDVLTGHDITMFNVSLSKSKTIMGKTLLVSNHAFLQDNWSLDTLVRFYWQTDVVGGKESIVSPTLRASYRMKTNLTIDAEGGVEATNSTPDPLTSSKTNRKYISFGFRWDF